MNEEDRRRINDNAEEYLRLFRQIQLRDAELERLKEANRAMREAILRMEQETRNNSVIGYEGVLCLQCEENNRECAEAIETADRILAGSGGGKDE